MSPQKGNKMSLNWNAENVACWDSLPRKRQDELCVSVAYQSMAIGINRITKNNISEWCKRSELVRKVLGIHGGCMDGPGISGEYYELEDPSFIKHMVGFHTNVTQLSQPKFLKKLYESYGRDRNESWRSINKKPENYNLPEGTFDD